MCWGLGPNSETLRPLERRDVLTETCMDCLVEGCLGSRLAGGMAVPGLKIFLMGRLMGCKSLPPTAILLKNGKVHTYVKTTPCSEEAATRQPW